MKKELGLILDSYQGEMIEMLRTLVRMPSVLSDAAPGAPYGKPIRQTLDAVLTFGKQKDFECVNFDNHACELNLPGNAAESVGIVSHLDVVPAGNGWTHDPFGAELTADGTIYGRGTVDDKGPLVAAFYACLAIRESNLPLSKKIKHIIGTNEEGGSFPCLEYYKAHADVPAVGIVPDSWFPAVYAEKGFLSYAFRRPYGEVKVSEATEKEGMAALELISIHGGEALNMVAAEATAELAVKAFSGGSGELTSKNDPMVYVYAEKLIAALQQFDQKGRLDIVRNGSIFTIKATGKAAHASTPELGENAIAILLRFLTHIYETFKPEFVPAALWKTISELAATVGNDTDGSGLGVSFCDYTGDLTNNIGLISFEHSLLTISMNLRSPVSYEREALEVDLAEAAGKLGMHYRMIAYNPHYYVPQDDPLVELLTGIYREITGDQVSMPKAHGGGSYARVLTNFVPFGPSMQDEPLCFHKQDESITGERLLLLSKIYAEALYRLAE